MALHEMKIGKAPSEVSVELIAASGGVGIKVMAEICQKVIDGFEVGSKNSGYNLQGEG